MDLFGAQGGANAVGDAGGQGGRTRATLAVTPGQVLQVNVGGRGGNRRLPAGAAEPAG
ncbi:MAG: hypothetical protein U0531_10300 [Dehalococcoidia bacterium]